MLQFIVNPKSGSGVSRKYAARLARFCNRRGIPYRLHETRYAGHCKELVARLEKEGEHDILVFGGDGTFHEAINGIEDFEHTRLGLSPCGSGNDFAACDKRAFHVKHPVRALRGVLNGRTRRIDYLLFDDGTRCLNIAGTGLDIEVLIKARALRRITGRPNYLKALLRVLKKFQPYPVTVTANGTTRRYDALLLGACNGKQIGGGIKVSPRSRIDDGVMRLVIVKDVPRERIKWLLPRFLRGKHIDMDICVETITDAVRIECETEHRIQLDGEIYSIPFSCRIVPAGLTLFC